jgi:hypothetical protein
MPNNACYRVETLQYPADAVTFPFLDAAYVITMEGSPREPWVREKLEALPPTATVHIVHNSGFRKCEKTLCAPRSNYDIVDANVFISEDAQRRGYDRVMTLEDDFEFVDDITAEDARAIDEFTATRRFSFYYPGMLPNIVVPATADFRHYRVLAGSTAHCVISTAESRRKLAEFVSEDTCRCEHVDLCQVGFGPTSYMYYRPLCTQLFPLTENRSKWGWLQDKTCNLLRLDRDTSPGYPLMYAASKASIPLIMIASVAVVALVSVGIAKATKRTRHR